MYVTFVLTLCLALATVGGSLRADDNPIASRYPGDAGIRKDPAVIFTDDQQHDSGQVSLEHVPLIYTFNLAGYRPSALPAGERGRYTLGGFTDATFRAVTVLEGGRDADWPF